MEHTAVKYAPGMRIIVRGEEWMVKKVETNSLGNQTLHVIGLSQLVKDYESMFLVDVEDDIEIVDPAKVTLVPDDSAFFRKSKVYIESQWRGKIPTDNKIHIGNKAAMDLMPYQLEPAQMVLNNTRQRILIADTVGLGKTLEAGILMSELIVRGKGKRILVVTVKSMMTQFQKEMWNRFTIPLVRLDSSSIHSVRAKIPTNYNPFFYYDKTIISVDTLKNDLEYRTHLENAWWDIIVIDEAHNVAKRGDRSSQRSKLASLLANRSDTLIMLTATPHDGKGQSVASLVNMLDPTAIADEENYTKDDIQGLLIRRFKKDIKDQVSGAFKERVITIERCAASAREEAAYDVFADMKLQMDETRARGKGILFKTSLEKSLFSSPAACIKSIDARIKKLEKKYPDGDMPDIVSLRELKNALELIAPADFSRYSKLIALLKSPEYGWTPAKNDDRLVIFTERIETMRYLAENLKNDLSLKDNQLEVIHGGMSDKELQRIVDEFGRAESPIRVIVASDVASEGINLHYLSHRLIHFDIPWSLMVFQQRNGRIDRYGQREQPDIRYMLIDSDNPKIKGDVRIMEILVKKEEQALKNIGDPAMLFGKFNQEEEEEETAKAIESGAGADAFEKLLDSDEEEFDPLELLMGLGDEKEVKVEYSDEETLFFDLDYVKNALDIFTDTEEIKYADLTGTQGVEIKLTNNVKKRIRKLMPPEAMPSDDYLRLSPDREYCLQDMKRCMQNDLAETAWPATQYLWKLHPIFNWIEDKSSNLEYYFDSSERLYSNRITLLLDKTDVIQDVKSRLKKYFDCIVFDEVQDISGRDFNFLEDLMKIDMNMLYVGDFYQHTYNTSADGNVNKSLFDDLNKYVDRFKKAGVCFDNQTLLKSWRCGEKVCQYVRDHLGISIYSNREEQGSVDFVDSDDRIREIWNNPEIVKLHYQKAAIYGFGHRNWGDTKGEDCYQDVCVLLNKTTMQAYKKDALSKLAASTRNKLYVAITRAKGNVYLIDEEQAKKLEGGEMMVGSLTEACKILQSKWKPHRGADSDK